MLVDKKIIVTGGNGFLGRHIVSKLEANNEVFVPKSKDYDLKSSDAAEQMLSDFRDTDIVVHAAADIGGIGYSSTHPAQQFYNNTLINLNVIHASYKAKIKKFVGIGSVCEYPANTPVPFREETLWDGYPVVTNDAYGLTKRMMLAQCSAYQKEYGFNFIHLLPVNLYGPYDDFDENNSHVIPALVRKISNAVDKNENNVDVWGTGDESREFLYVEDAAQAVVLATEKYNKTEPVNLGSGQEITIKEIAKIIAEILDYKGKFTFLNNGLGGQQRRMLDVSKAKNEFGFISETSFFDGLKNVVDYYLNNKLNLQ